MANQKRTLPFLDMHPINRPEVIVTLAAQKVDDKGRLTDDKARDLIRSLLESLAAWTRKLQSGR